jgi:hypothetical protein
MALFGNAPFLDCFVAFAPRNDADFFFALYAFFAVKLCFWVPGWRFAYPGYSLVGENEKCMRLNRKRSL